MCLPVGDGQLRWVTAMRDVAGDSGSDELLWFAITYTTSASLHRHTC